MRIRVLKWLIGLACWSLAPAVVALTISDVDLKSSLNQPLDARIDLLGATENELSSLKVELHENREDYQDQRHIVLRHEIKQDADGHSYIQISTEDAVREPILVFILEANWSDGRFLREYSLIMDPQ